MESAILSISFCLIQAIIGVWSTAFSITSSGYLFFSSFLRKLSRLILTLGTLNAISITSSISICPSPFTSTALNTASFDFSRDSDDFFTTRFALEPIDFAIPFTDSPIFFFSLISLSLTSLFFIESVISNSSSNSIHYTKCKFREFSNMIF